MVSATTTLPHWQSVSKRAWLYSKKFLFTLTSDQPSLQTLDRPSVNQKAACTRWPETKRGGGGSLATGQSLWAFQPCPKCYNKTSDLWMVTLQHLQFVSHTTLSFPTRLSGPLINRNAANKWVTASALITESNPSQGGKAAKPLIKAACLLLLTYLNSEKFTYIVCDVQRIPWESVTYVKGWPRIPPLSVTSQEWQGMKLTVLGKTV